MNLDRGFGRFTAALSAAFFVSAVIFVVLTGRDRLDPWRRAGQPLPEGPPLVYAVGVGIVEFPTRFGEAEIRGALDRNWLKMFRGNFPEYNDLADLELAGALANKFPDFLSRQFELLRKTGSGSFKRDAINFIYWPTFGPSSSVLYNRAAILRAEAKGDLPQGGGVLLRELRGHYAFPNAISAPWSLLEWAGYSAITICIAAVPWATSFTIRWIVRGFAAG